MTSRTLRRRLHHGDVDGKKHEHLVSSDLDDLNEPLLGNNENDNKQSEVVLVSYLFPCSRCSLTHSKNVLILLIPLQHRETHLKPFGVMNKERNNSIGHFFFLN